MPNKAWTDDKRAKGLCTRCGARPACAGRSRCFICRLAIAKENSERYALNKAAGICVTCRKEVAAPGHVSCEKCLLRMKKYNIKYAKERDERGKC